MNRAGRTFSDSWYRIADLKVSLRPTVAVRKHYFRGALWYILHDPFNNQFFRLRPASWAFVSRLRPDRPVSEVWQRCLERHPDETPGQEDVIHLLTQLFSSSLLFFETPADTEKVFGRYEKRRTQEMRSRLMSVLFMRIPLWDPEQTLQKISGLIRLLVGPVGGMVWAVTVLAALKVFVDGFDRAMDQAQGVLAPDNLIFLYLALLVIKGLHEFGHAFACKRFGGEIHTMGIMLLILTPMPYIDTTSSWSFRSRRHRAFVGAAGILAEIFMAALATLVWAHTGAGGLHSLAYNIMFLASFSTLVFNANPLLRFDGYYIFSDLLDIPNLHTQARAHLKYLAQRYLFGIREASTPAEDAHEAFWLTGFGVASALYRVIVFVGILFFVADMYLPLGALMVCAGLITWGVMPLVRMVGYLAVSPDLVKNRCRAVSITLLAGGLLLILLLVYPFPSRFTAPGVLAAESTRHVFNDTAGYVDQLLVPSSTWVATGTPLIRLRNRELTFEIREAMAQYEETLALYKKAALESAGELDSILKRLTAHEMHLDNLRRKESHLIVRAHQRGLWVSPQGHEMVGVWLARGRQVGDLVDPERFQFSAVVPQKMAAHLFEGRILGAVVRLYGQAQIDLGVDDYQIIPFEQKRLPSAALGWRSGGGVATSMADRTGLETVEPFFHIYAHLKPDVSVAFFQGRSGKICFVLPDQPLVGQAIRYMRQLIQKRYQL